MGKVIKLIEKILDRVEPDITIELEEIVFSKKHGHEICIMRLVGKNIFPRMTTDEILNNPKAMSGLSKEDLITITRLDMEIKLRRNRLRVVEFDRNGTIVLENEFRERKTYSEKILVGKPEILDQLSGREGCGIGHRVASRELISSGQQKQMLLKKILSFLKFIK